MITKSWVLIINTVHHCYQYVFYFTLRVKNVYICFSREKWKIHLSHHRPMQCPIILCEECWIQVTIQHLLITILNTQNKNPSHFVTHFRLQCIKYLNLQLVVSSSSIKPVVTNITVFLLDVSPNVLFNCKMRARPPLEQLMQLQVSHLQQVIAQKLAVGHTGIPLLFLRAPK